MCDSPPLTKLGSKKKIVCENHFFILVFITQIKYKNLVEQMVEKN